MNRVGFLVLGFVSIGAWSFAKYPMTVFSRPFTMPRNSFETALRFSNSNAVSLSADYGITDHFQLGLSWAGLQAGNEPDQKISLNLAHYLFATKYLSSMAIASIPFHFDASVVKGMSLSMATYIPLVRGYLNLVLLENLITIDWSSNPQAIFAFETRLSWQATEALCLNLVTNWAQISTTGDYEHVGLRTPLFLKALYAVTPMIDVFGQIGYNNLQKIDRKEGGLIAMLGIALRGGSIEE
ncbi:MAG: hypothetical protein I8H75_01260 [Myxococcaceae bacterium]|nr:hypothetical protein [Myxococcaceae bacterium]MBH2005970.1 hypothetical protein [Myxococcaceae bacterium]